MNRRTIVIVGAVVLHLTLTAAHGAAHYTIPVEIATWQEVYVVSVLVVLPLLGTAFVINRRLKLGCWLIFGSGVASLAFESLFHFIVSNPDHIAHVHIHVQLFGLTAVLSAVGDLLLITIAGWYLSQLSGEQITAMSEHEKRGEDTEQ